MVYMSHLIFVDASFPHHLADLALLPAKMFPELLLDNQESQHREGTRTYVRVVKWTARYCYLIKDSINGHKIFDILQINALEPLELVLEERIKQKSMEFT